MSTLEIVVRCLAGLALIAGNALFVVSEFSLTRVPQFSRERVEEVAGSLPWEMTEKLEIYLTACQLGISLTSITLGIVSEPAVTASIRPLAETIGLEGGALTAVSFSISLLLINLTQKIWGEQAPTYLGVERPLQVARVTAPILFWWTRVTYPLVIAGDTLAKWTLRIGGIKITRSWTQAEEEGDERGDSRDPRRKLIDTVASFRLPPDRRDEIVASYEIGEMPVREIATGPDEIVYLDAERAWADNAAVLADHSKTRLPLVRGSLDDVVGFIYLPALFSRLEELRDDAASLDELASPPLWVDGDVDVAAFIDILQQEKQEIALIRGDDGELIGLATATDAFEAITGELEDPLDVAERDEDR